MTAIGAATSDIIYDLFLALGLSVAVWFCYHIMILITPAKRLWLTIPLHILFFAAAGFLGFCFIVGETASRQPRWHMILGFMLGAWIYFAWLARYIRYARHMFTQLFKLTARPARWLVHLLRRRVIKPVGNYLQKRRQMRYNKRMEMRAKKTARDGENGHETKQKKEPIRAYSES